MSVDLRIALPRIMWEDALAASLSSSGLQLSNLPKPSAAPDGSPRVTFDWCDVRFFDDLALLKFLMIEYALRHAAVHVRHTGLSRGGRKTAAVARQLWTCGYIELLTSCQLWGPDLARRGDVTDLLGFDPSSSPQGDKAIVSVSFQLAGVDEHRSQRVVFQRDPRLAADAVTAGVQREFPLAMQKLSK